MKNRIISMALASAMLAGSLFSCAEKDIIAYSSRISTASSDADEYAVWLTDRLETVPEDIVLGIGSDNTYGVDMSSFEDDGYVIKRNSDGVVIFGKTNDGLDRAVRKYANMTDDGEFVENITYHEGYRIEKFTLFGADIADYAIEYPADANENVKFAVSELQKLLKKACGVELAAYPGDSDSERKIIFRTTDDANLRDDGYRYFEETGNLVIEGAVKRGCMWGVYRFLENECGWDHLTFGTSYLNETDLLEIPAGLSETETPAFEYADDSSHDEGYPAQKYYFVNEKSNPTEAQNSYGAIKEGHHGLSRNKWLGADITYDGSGITQPCFTDDYNLELAYENITAWLQKQETAGRLWGREISYIDISQGDGPMYCMCPDCMEIYAYDGSYIGPIVQFANELAEMLDADYPDMKLQIFGYFETVKPPAVTRPTDAVYITYAPNGNCVKHSLGEGELCTNKIFQNWNNVEYGGFLEEWCEMSNNVYVWYYSWGLYPISYTMLDVFYKDMKWFEELGVKGIYINRMRYLYDTTYLTDYMLRDLNWDTDKTEDEYEEYLDEIFEHVYGDGWEAVRAAEELQYQAQMKDERCHDIWMYSTVCPVSGTYDPFYYDTVFKQIIEYMDYAMKRADSAETLHRCRMYAAGLIYMGCTGAYFAAYDAEDTEKLEWLEAQYARIREFTEAEGFDPIVATGLSIPDTLEELMWTQFLAERDRYTADGATQRPAPDWVTETTSTVTA